MRWHLTIRSSRARFAASCKFLQVSLAQGRKAARLNSGVRRRQTKIFSTWGSPTERHCNLHSLSATYSVQLESSCTPSVDELAREKLAGAQNQFCAAGSGCPSIRGLLRSARNSSLVSRLTIRPSRHRFAASCKVPAIETNTPPQSGAS